MTSTNAGQPPEADQQQLMLLGVSTHNLKNLDITIAKGAVTAVMGVSGSGKSSLVFTTLYGAAFGRFLAIQKSRLQRKLDARLVPRPQLKGSVNLPAAIALRQHLPFFPQRATVGSYSEIFPVLRRLIVAEGQRYCPDSGEPLRRYSPQLVAQTLAPATFNQANSDQEGRPEQGIFAAPVSRGEGSSVSTTKLVKELLAAGFSRYLTVAEGGEATVGKLQALVDTTSETTPESEQLDLAVVVDKTSLTAANHPRIEEAVSLAYRISDGELIVAKGDGKATRFFRDLSSLSSQKRWPELSPSHYNPASEEGSCPACHGIGRTYHSRLPSVVDEWQALRPELELPAATKRQLDQLASKAGTSLGQLVAAIFEADDSFATETLLQARLSSADCTSCGGTGIRRESLATSLFGIPFGDWLELSVTELHKLLTEHQEALEAANQPIPSGLIELITATETLVSLRLAYLSLAEKARHLSGGEVQRIGLAKVLSSDLHDCLICLDEPSACLHPADVATVLSRIKSLADLGNTVVVVDHHPLIQTIADHSLFIGPYGGVQGGRLVTGLPPFEPPTPSPYPESCAELTLTAINYRYFKDAALTLPMAKTSRRPAPLIGIAGISGSGKSTLVKDILIPCLNATEGQLPAKISLPRQVTTRFLDQKALGRSSRSTLLTYLGLAAPLRKAFAAHPESRRRGYTAAHFNRFRKEGACPRCGGLGYISSRWQAEDTAPCPDCGGHGFKKSILDIKHLDLSILDIHQLTLTDALTAFAEEPWIVQALEPLATFGLGYMTLGQATSTYSGGQAQRLRLAKLMRDVGSTEDGAASAKRQAPPLVILDEPSLGLSPYDVAGLIRQFQAMAARGITVIIVEHNLDILRCCQWLVELGPGAGPKGSQIIYQGPRDDHPGDTPLGAFL